MRHHRRQQLHEDAPRLGESRTIRLVAGLGLVRQVVQGIGELVEMGDAAVEAQALHVVLDGGQRLVRGLAHGGGNEAGADGCVRSRAVRDLAD